MLGRCPRKVKSKKKSCKETIRSNPAYTDASLLPVQRKAIQVNGPFFVREKWGKTKFQTNPDDENETRKGRRERRKGKKKKEIVNQSIFSSWSELEVKEDSENQRGEAKQKQKQKQKSKAKRRGEERRERSKKKRKKKADEEKKGKTKNKKKAPRETSPMRMSPPPPPHEQSPIIRGESVVCDARHRRRTRNPKSTHSVQSL